MINKTGWAFKIARGFLVTMTFVSLSAEIWSNNRPIVMKYHDQIWFPAWRRYHVSNFAITDSMAIDYDGLDYEWAVWPLNRWGPNQSNLQVSSYPSPPSLDNWLGTDDRGRDVLARLIYGFRYSIFYAVLVWGMSSLIAVLIGGLSGFSGGWVDLVGMRFIEVLSTVPQLFLLMYLISIFEPSLTLLVIVSSTLGWMGLSFYVRAEVLRVRNLGYIEAAKASGAGTWRILTRHMVPNSLSPVFAFAPFAISGNMTGLTVLDFLGFGLPPPTPSWGELLQQGQVYFQTAWWLATFPSLALFSTLIGITLVGEGLQSRARPARTGLLKRRLKKRAWRGVASPVPALP